MSLSCLQKLKPGDIVYYETYCIYAEKVITIPFNFVRYRQNDRLVIYDNNNHGLSFRDYPIVKIVKKQS